MTHQISGLFKNLITALFIVLSLTSFSQDISSDAGVITQGETLFNSNCKACHRVDQKLIGPALAGIEDRAPSIDWIKEFVRNSSKLIASGDEYANKVYEESGKILMTSFTSLSDDQIMSILAYVKAEAEKPEEVATVADGGGTGSGDGVPPTYLNAILVGMIVILVLLLVILGLIISSLKRYLDQKDLTEEDREVVHSPFTFSSIVQSTGFIFIVVFLVASISFKTVIDGLYTIGVQQGYAPKQPIAFSHKVHAGEYEIDCQYCHTGAIKGRSANIPSPNICMNCHTQIRSGTNTGETEIAKIVSAIETNRPIEWVRVHNLPDLAYFNHSQHVNVGGIECQTCHGPIEEMDVVKQYSLLTMGWCIDCHRTTDLNTKGNEYYDNLLELHNNNAMKVEDIGGLECAKCHY
ncbi:MAG TPA: c-type cytochrome [Cyclobacteriaceae bacterium]|nr:c-type cytochrome [Cyclobacteriaceae bacterium]